VSSSPLTPLRGGGGESVPMPKPSPPPPGRRGTEGEAFSRGPGMTKRARALRNDMTRAENALWAQLRRDRLGVRFRRQLVFDQRFILDFYAPSLKLAIEVDGGQHAVDAGKDALRTGYLVKRGVSVLRFWNNEVLVNMDGVLMSITAVIEALGNAFPLTPPRGGGRESVPMPKPSPPPPVRSGTEGDAIAHLRLEFGEIV